jgi:hypothetical protein
VGIPQEASKKATGRIRMKRVRLDTAKLRTTFNTSSSEQQQQTQQENQQAPGAGAIVGVTPNNIHTLYYFIKKSTDFKDSINRRSYLRTL